jgi:flagellar biosynthesis/type III secretory pathway protein FliH
VPADDGAFVSLAQLLRGGERGGEPEIAERDEAVAPIESCVAAYRDVARDVRVFRARLSEAFEAAREALVRELAYAVLGRELVLAPADVAAIAARVLAEHPSAQPLSLRVAHRSGGLPPCIADESLAPGDAVLELACGHVDARLGVRLAAVLDEGA